MKKRLTNTKTVLSKINKAFLKFLVPLSPEESYKIIAEEAIKLVSAEYGSVFLSNKDKLERVYASLPVLHTLIPRKGGPLYKAFRSKKSMVLSIEEVSKVHPTIAKMMIKSIVVTPLSYRNRTVGILTLESTKEENFTNKELDILNLFGSVASLTIKKNQLYNEAKNALENRDLYISLAAHEMRTPLTTISVYAQLLKKRLRKKKTPVMFRWINDLSLEALRLNNLVNEFLAVNRIKSGAFLYLWKECSLGEVIMRSLKNFKHLHPEREVKFQDFQGSDIVIGDFDKLLQVFINILDNAAKFSPKNTDIHLKLYAQKSRIVVEIKDLGKGIPKDEVPHIFDEFFKAKVGNKDGMGMGLFLGKSIINKHKGSIKVTSRVGKWTKFEVRIPRAKVFLGKLTL